jgi:tRNA G10  N-methylase Trm11
MLNHPTTYEEFKETLKKHLMISFAREDIKKVEEQRPPEERFFRTWFRQAGEAYFFLFRKNLKVTNIQFAELLALLRSHSTDTITKRPVDDLRFLSTTEFKTAIMEIMEAFQQYPEDVRYQTAVELYWPLLSRTAVIDNYYGSCAVYIPCHLEIDLPLICAYSGYIHSCGHMVFFRNIEKADKDTFFTDIDNYLENHKDSDKPTLFSVYAHEDFTKLDRGREEYLRDGLDDVKIYLEKYYVGSERLVDVLREMRSLERFKNRLLIPEPGDYKAVLGGKRGITTNAPHLHPDYDPSSVKYDEAAAEVDPSKTLWLLVDYAIGEPANHRGDDRYYICYEQRYLNENPFHLFDENKPAWIAPTTIPHTLLAAMINITGLSRSPDGDQIVLADPFVGTGTTWLEACKLLPGIEQHCTDKAPIAPVLARDNLAFFSSDYQGLMNYWKELKEYDIPRTPRLDDSWQGRARNAHDKAIIFFDKLLDLAREELAKGQDQSDSLKQKDLIEKILYCLQTQENLDEFERMESGAKIFFYLSLRTVQLGIAERERGEGWESTYSRQVARMLIPTAKLIDLRKREADTGTPMGSFSLIQGYYSKSCTISQKVLAELHEQITANNTQWPAIQICDATEEKIYSLKPNTCNLIITDPPYGFNTDDDAKDLAGVYDTVLRKMIEALRPEEGHLVLCLLDRSFTGRRSLSFTRKEIIIQQVLSIAEHLKPRREVIVQASAVPHHRALFRPPYYWESERALRRAILHFTFRAVSQKTRTPQRETKAS